MTTATRRDRREFLRLLSGVGLGFSCGGVGSVGRALAWEEPTLINADTEAAIERGLRWLAGRQNEDGSLGSGNYARNTGVVGIAGLAFLAQGSSPRQGPWSANLLRAHEFLFAETQGNGLISKQQQSRGPMYEHAFATLLLAESLGTWNHPALRPTLSRAVDLIVASQNDEGGWRYQPRRDDADVSVTAAQVMALRAARNGGIFVPDQCVANAVDYLKRSQNEDGGFLYMGEERESAFPRSAAAIVALFNAGVSDGQAIENGLSYLADSLPNSEELVGPLPSHFFYGHYYAVQAMWHAGPERFAKWYVAIRDLLLERQLDEGQWEDQLAGEYATAMALIILQVPNNLLPILQR
ncbi:MAG: prenyltransferase/squalene oxidase repeat-containing protein [Pirellulaceae bacterium]